MNMWFRVALQYFRNCDLEEIDVAVSYSSCLDLTDPHPIILIFFALTCHHYSNAETRASMYTWMSNCTQTQSCSLMHISSQRIHPGFLTAQLHFQIDNTIDIKLTWETLDKFERSKHRNSVEDSWSGKMDFDIEWFSIRYVLRIKNVKKFLNMWFFFDFYRMPNESQIFPCSVCSL